MQNVLVFVMYLQGFVVEKGKAGLSIMLKLIFFSVATKSVPVSMETTIKHQNVV